MNLSVRVLLQVIGLIVALGLTAGLAARYHDNNDFREWAEVFGNLSTGLAGVLVVLAVAQHVYEAQERNYVVVKDGLAQFTGLRSYRIRGYLHSRTLGFDHDFRETEKRVGKGKAIETESEAEGVHDALKSVKAKLTSVNTESTNADISAEDISALEAIELTLMDFDLVAVPFDMRIGTARKLADRWKPVITATAEHIVPFIRNELLWRSDWRTYKSQYLRLVKYALTMPKDREAAAWEKDLKDTVNALLAAQTAGTRNDVLQIVLPKKSSDYKSPQDNTQKV